MDAPLPLFCCWVFFACCHIRFSPVHPFHFSFNTTRPQITKQKTHDEIRKVFGQQVSAENRVCSSLSDIFCRLQCNNPPEELNPVPDTGSIRRKDPWQMETEQKSNAQCKQFLLRMITAKLITCWREFVESTKFASLSNVRIEPKIDPKYKTTSHCFYINLLFKELSKHCPISSQALKLPSSQCIWAEGHSFSFFAIKFCTLSWGKLGGTLIL
jgi:hypothetical protein